MEDRAELVLYDEDCGICAAFARALARRGLRVAPIGSPIGDTWLRDLSLPARYEAFHAIDGRGRRRSAGAAVPPVLRVLPAGEVSARLARALPRLTALAYVAVARSRRQLSAALALSACAAPHRTRTCAGNVLEPGPLPRPEGCRLDRSTRASRARAG
ncbi:MAG TPA: DCC1-like thiol-disulfide oxidoreductase family protein [Gaiella sp.]|uniref:DCC1-like thiol-disulfide oxidoreductase family protein n=1 Tax=Gaiella sp. TaxID=2663207 RepID=UPI002D7E2003|nr:DCC1-like thiol-disulfide oxidoreductase family protein [Gaiella sp.]HET9287332.1 DCC1-like thiol-disulfide oxidoreductase family protein [Gaiella sp.]